MEKEPSLKKLPEISKIIRNFVILLAVFSFCIANYVIFLILSKFIYFTANKYILFLSTLLISFLLVKPHFFIKTNREMKIFFQKLRNNFKKLPKGIKKIENFGRKFKKFGIWNTFLIIFRLTFFNILNDAFMILITWCSILYVYSFLDMVSITNLNGLVGVITSLGVLLGVFQFYIRFYQEQIVKNISNKIVRYISNISRELSFMEFLSFLEKNHKQYYEKIVEEKLRPLSLFPLIKFHKDMRSSGKEILNITMNVYSSNEILLAHLMEKFVKDEIKMKKFYEEFFNEKNRILKEKLNKKDVEELRKMIVPNVLFFDEIMAEILNLVYFSELEEEKEPVTYQEFLQRSLRDNIFYLMEKIMGVESGEKEATNNYED